ncbi:MAG: hypothetical protein AAFV80_06845 [Bacteroidota bacterium]
MNIRRKNIILVLLLTLGGIPLLAQSAWVSEKGKGYFKASTWWVIADAHFTGNGGIDPNITSGVVNNSIYADYGITNRISAIVYFPFYSKAYNNNLVSATTGEVIQDGEVVNGIGDTDISINVGIIQNKPVVWSASLTLGLPLGIDDGGSQGTLQTGDGEFNQMIRTQVGTGFKLANIDFYTQGFVGYNNRTNGFSDEFRFGLELGATFWERRILASMRLIGIESLQNGDSMAPINSTSLFANNAESLAFSPEIAYVFNDKWGFSANLGKAISGRLIFANTTYSVGAFLKL